ncbi:MAG: patatin-like phospholipase family protein, partial [Anaerolineales bacterium]|nr:patatin-like phospholipase family protein [Anaerolineales bacterium]
MKPFRKNVAIAIDGGGIRGIIPAKALMMLEQELGKTVGEIFRLSVGTSTGAILAAGIASGLNAQSLLDLYLLLGDQIFKKLRWPQSWIWLWRGYRYSRQPLVKHFGAMLQDKTLGDLWNAKPSSALVTTTYDLITNQTRFVKTYKPEYQDWPVIKAVIASSAAPTYFPVIEGRFTDGGVGSYNNPCFLAAFEAVNYLKWDVKETTLISLGTGRALEHVKVGDPDRYTVIDWVPQVIESRAQDATDQQIGLVKLMFPGLDFRRIQVDLKEPIGVDAASKIPDLLKYGEEMGTHLLNDKWDRIKRPAINPAPKMSKAP